MKRLAFIFVLIALLFGSSFIANARGIMTMCGAGVPVSASSCPTSETLLLDELSTDSFKTAGYASTIEYRGQAAFNPNTDLGGGATICTVGIGFRAISGDISAVNWQVEIYEMSSTSLGSAPSGTCVSDTRKITGSYPIGELKFTGLSCVLDPAKTYGIALIRTDGSYDATNYAQVFISTSSNYTGYSAAWNVSTKARTDDDSSYDISLRLYGY